MPIRQLPEKANLEHLKKQARILLREFLQGEPAAVARLRKDDSSSTAPKLADALHVIAVEYGFTTWPSLKTHVEMLSEDPAEVMKAAIRANDAGLVRRALERYPVLKSRIDEPLPDFSFDAPALIGAVNKENREMVEVLLAAGANINARTKWWAGSFGVLDTSSPDFAAYLIGRGAYVDIHAAARLGMLDRVKELVAGDPGLVHARGGDGQMPLHFAANVAIAEYLLEQGAEIDVRDIDHESTAAQYMAAVLPRRPEVAQYLISRGAKTDILMASALGDTELVRQLLDDDPDGVRVSVWEHFFPKENPRSGGSIYIFGFGWGKTPHLLAHESGHEETFRLLMQRSPLGLRLSQACEIGDEAQVRELMARQPNLVQRLSSLAVRRIISAAIRNNTSAVRMMLGTGWPADAVGEKGHTALHWAAWHGNVEMVRDLLDHHAPLEAQELEHGGTPLKWAMHGSENGWHRNKGDYAGTVQLLLEAGAQAPALSEDGGATEEVLAALRRYSR